MGLNLAKLCMLTLFGKVFLSRFYTHTKCIYQFHVFFSNRILTSHQSCNANNHHLNFLMTTSTGSNNFLPDIYTVIEYKAVLTLPARSHRAISTLLCILYVYSVVCTINANYFPCIRFIHDFLHVNIHLHFMVSVIFQNMLFGNNSYLFQPSFSSL